MENGPFIDGLPIKNGDFPWQTVSHNQMVFRSISPRNFSMQLRKSTLLHPFCLADVTRRKKITALDEAMARCFS
jgi:hypothetical protein